MIDAALSFFASEINAYLKSRTGMMDNVVAVNGIVDEAGKYTIEDGQVAVTVINIEEETNLKDPLPEFKYIHGRHTSVEPKIRLNLFVIFAARFNLYEQALKHLSLILTFFQSHKVFSHDSHPALSHGLERLTVDLQKLSYDELNQIWAYIGGKHLPSVVYKIRLVSIQDQAPAKVQPPLTVIDTQIQAR